MAGQDPTHSPTSGRRIFVTGANGFIGAALCRRLAGRGDTVTAAVRAGSDRRRLGGIGGSLSIAEVDLTDPVALKALVGSLAPHVVFHLASTVFNPPGLTAFDHLDGNLRTTLVVLEAVKDRPDCRFIHTGSAAEYPPGSRMREDLGPAPANLYGAMKACASLLVDSYARIYRLRTARAVLFTVFGPGEQPHRLVPSTILSALRAQDVHLRDGSAQRDMLHVEEVVDGLCRMADTDLPPGTAVNLCSGRPVAVRHIAGTILRLMDSPVTLVEHREQARADEIMTMDGDNGRALELLGWRPRLSLEDGLERTIAWHRKQHPTAENTP